MQTNRVIFYEFLLSFVFMAVFSLTWAVWDYGFSQHQVFAVITLLLGVLVGFRNRHNPDKAGDWRGNWCLLVVLGLIVLATPYLFHFALIHDVATDEGRLFYDSSLLLDGGVPYRDFHTRSPLLIYALAGSQWMFGPTVIAGRIVSVVSLLLSGFLVYLVGKHLHSKPAGVIGAAIFLFYPIVWISVLCKTQTFQTPFVLLFFYLLILALKKEQARYLVLSGIALALAFLVRESSAIYILTLPVLLVYSDGLRSAIAKTACVAAPFATIVGFSVLGFGTLGSGVGSFVEGHLVRMTIEEMQVHFELGILLILFFVPLMIAVCSGILGLGRVLPLRLIIPFWCGSLMVFYMWYALMSKWFEQYWLEFMPVFALAAAVAFLHFIKIPKVKSRAVALGLIAVFVMLSMVAWIKLEEDPPRYTIAAVDEATEFLECNTAPGDVIFCGSPIWAYTTKTYNAGNMSHYTPDQLELIERDFEYGKVSYIVMDGYAGMIIEESVYLQYEYENNYQEVKTINKGSYWDICILERK